MAIFKKNLGFVSKPRLPAFLGESGTSGRTGCSDHQAALAGQAADPRPQAGGPSCELPVLWAPALVVPLPGILSQEPFPGRLIPVAKVGFSPNDPPSWASPLIICNRVRHLLMCAVSFPGMVFLGGQGPGQASPHLSRTAPAPRALGAYLVADQTASEGLACSALVPGTSELGLTPVPSTPSRLSRSCVGQHKVAGSGLRVPAL